MKEKKDMKRYNLCLLVLIRWKGKKWSNKKKYTHTHTYIYTLFFENNNTKQKKNTRNKINAQVGMVCVYIKKEKKT
jgi:hypothetical protein